MSGLIPQSLIDEVLSRAELVELIDDYVHLKKHGRNYLGLCPFHNEKTPSFHVLKHKQFYHCFGCGSSGNAISFVMEYLKQDFPEAVRTLAARVGLEVIYDDKNSTSRTVTINLHNILEQVNKFYVKTLKDSSSVAINYLKSRGINGEIAKEYQLGYAPLGWHTLKSKFKKHTDNLIASGMLICSDDNKIYDRYRHRIMFPIHNHKGNIVGFGGRALDDAQQPKYLNSPETAIFQKKREVYGLFQLLQIDKKPEKILIVEGYLDVIALAQFGVSNVVAALGTAISKYQIQLLSRYTKHLIFCFDGDAAGTEAAFRTMEHCLTYLNPELEIQFIFIPNGHDPDSLIREEGRVNFLERLRKAQTLSQLLLHKLTDGIDLTQIDGKYQLINRAKISLNQIADKALRQLLLDELSRITHIDIARLTELMCTGIAKIHHNIVKPNVNPAKNKPVNLAPLQVAAAILLQNPEFYRHAHDIIRGMIFDPEDHKILWQLLQQIAVMPNPTTMAMVIESWREHPLFKSLLQLATWQHQIPDVDLLNEFTDILRFLQKQMLEKKINQYIVKSKIQSLTFTEKQILQNLLLQRHGF